VEIFFINVAVKTVVVLVALTIVGVIGMATTGFCPPVRGPRPIDAPTDTSPGPQLKSMFRLACLGLTVIIPLLKKLPGSLFALSIFCFLFGGLSNN
jgi:hypothetical protein